MFVLSGPAFLILSIEFYLKPRDTLPRIWEKQNKERYYWNGSGVRVHTKYFFNSHPTIRIWIKHPHHKFFCFLRNLWPRVPLKIYSTPNNSMSNAFLRFCTSYKPNTTLTCLKKNVWPLHFLIFKSKFVSRSLTFCFDPRIYITAHFSQCHWLLNKLFNSK